MPLEVHVGFDDTDSPLGGCTTYIGARLVEILAEKGFAFLDYPNLVRLNPNIPWKTRGNGAVCLRLSVGGEGDYEELKETVLAFIRSHYEKAWKDTEPAVAFLRGSVPPMLRSLSQKALRRVVEPREALRVLRACGGEALELEGRQGVVGAAAAVGETLEGDHTYEAVAYRLPERRGEPRAVSFDSVVEMDRATRPWTFNNLDPETGRVLVTPRGPDPVLLGVRGETPEAVKKALSMVETGEKPERWAVFRTNQGTDAHLGETVKIRDIPPYSAVVVEGFVAQPPQTAPGGHVIFRLKDATGEIFCAAYEPTGNFRNTVRALRVGDRVKVYGGLRKAQPLGPRTVNLEKLEVLETAPVVEFRSPLCPRCGKRMTSMGAHKGFRCEKCKHRSSTLRRVPFPIPRSLSSGLYMPPPRAHRHLTKPLSRYGLEKAGKPGSPPRPEAFWGLGPPA